MAAVDYFLKIDGIPGESQDHKHKGEIDLHSWSWGETNSGSAAQGGGGGAGKVAMNDFHFVMGSNSASPKLMLHCANGHHIPKAVLTCRKAGGKEQLEYLKITLSDFIVSSYQAGGSAHSDVIPVDQISLNFSKIEIEYKEQKKEGGGGGAVKAGWDLKANKEV